MESPNFGKFESLHNHTVISDGQQTYEEVLRSAEGAGFSYIAFTDHDVLPDARMLESLRGYDGLVEWEVGIEITSGLPVELGGKSVPLFHLLGLRVDQSNHALREYCNDAKEARLERLKRTVDNLRSAGFLINLDDCLEEAGDGSVGTPHISRVLLKDEANVHRLESIAEDMYQKSSEDPELRARYDQMMRKVQSGQRHPYVRDLLFSDDAYLSGVYVPYLFSLDMDRTVELIRRAGGVAVMAHWPTVRDTITPSILESIAANRRVDGIELRSVFNADPVQIQEDMCFLQGIASRHGLLTTVGIDGHSAADFDNFSAIPGALDSSVGQRERLDAYEH